MRPRSALAALGLGELPQVDRVQIDRVVAVRRERTRDLRPVLGRVVDRLGEDGRAEVLTAGRIGMADQDIRLGRLRAEAGVRGLEEPAEVGQLLSRGWRLDI